MKSATSANSESNNPTVVMELKNVSLSFGSLSIFQNLNLSVRKNESLVLIGPSGQGKTSLLKLLAGLQRPVSGAVEISGENWDLMNNAKRFEKLKVMGMLFQKNALFDSMTNAENIAFPVLETAQKTEAEISALVHQRLSEVGLSGTENLYPSEISGGMQKRLGIARALALQPEILLYDDPTAGLDPITSRKIADLILEMKKQHQATIVVTTNDMNRAYQLADRIVYVSKEEVIVTGTPEETKKHSNLKVQNFIRGLN